MRISRSILTFVISLGRLQNGHKAMSVRDAEVLSFGTSKECGAKKQSVSGRYDNNFLE